MGNEQNVIDLEGSQNPTTLDLSVYISWVASKSVIVLSCSAPFMTRMKNQAVHPTFLVKLEKVPAEVKRQSIHQKTTTSLRIKNGRMRTSQLKAMMLVFFDMRGVIIVELVSIGQNIIQKHYLRGPDQDPRATEEEKGRIMEEIVDSASRQ